MCEVVEEKQVTSKEKQNLIMSSRGNLCYKCNQVSLK